MKIYLAVNAYGVKKASTDKKKLRDYIKEYNKPLIESKFWVNNELLKYQEIELENEKK